MSLIYKILSGTLWEQARSAGVFSGAGIDLADGYIHFSDAKQAQETADKHFLGQTGLVVLEVDAAKLGEALKWERARGGALFPHLYRELKVDEVQSVFLLPIGDDGRHVFRF